MALAPRTGRLRISDDDKAHGCMETQTPEAIVCQDVNTLNCTAAYSAGAPVLLDNVRSRLFANRRLRRFTRAFWYAAISGAERK